MLPYYDDREVNERMRKYKPEHLGQVMPSADDPPKLKGFLQDQYEQFNKVYRVCSDSSASINELRNVSGENSASLEVKVLTSTDETLADISARVDDLADSSVSMIGDTVTVDTATVTDDTTDVVSE